MDGYHGRVPTLLVFTLGAKHESRRRHLLPEPLNTLEDRLHQACLDSALEAGRAVGCRLEVSSPFRFSLPSDVHHREQQGKDFGCRLEGATKRAFEELGNQPLLLVGSDVPELSAGHLRRALDALHEDRDRVVVGPSPDGGFYLLAASRPVALSHVRWRCKETLRSLKRALRRQGRPVVMLPPLVDLDRRSDLERWLSGIKNTDPGLFNDSWLRLSGHLLEALASLRKLGWSKPSGSRSISSTGLFLQRGPPNAIA